MDLENSCDKYLGPISFKILYISTAMILMDEILNESNSLLDNKTHWNRWHVCFPWIEFPGIYQD